MANSADSLELLSYFDGPAERERQLSSPVVRTRGVRWVLLWATALGMLVVASSILMQFAYCVAAERALGYAARAGAIEATLPRATHESITNVVRRRLEEHAIPTAQLNITVRRNDLPLPRMFRVLDDDRIAVSVAMPTESALPAWLRAVAFGRGEPFIHAVAEQRMPGKQLKLVEH